MMFRLTKMMLTIATVTSLSTSAAVAQIYQTFGDYSMPFASEYPVATAGAQAISTVGTASVKRKPTNLAHLPGTSRQGRQHGRSPEKNATAARCRTQPVGNAQGRQRYNQFRQSQPVQCTILAAKTNRSDGYGKNTQSRKKTIKSLAKSIVRKYHCNVNRPMVIEGRNARADVAHGPGPAGKNQSRRSGRD